MPIRLTNRFSADRDMGPARVDTNFEDVRRWSGDVDESFTAVNGSLGTLGTDLGALDGVVTALDGVVTALDTALGVAEADIVQLSSRSEQRNTGQTITDATWTTVDWTLHVAGTNWVTNINRVTPSTAGVYYPTAFAQWSLGGFTPGTDRQFVRISHSIAGQIGHAGGYAATGAPLQSVAGIPQYCNGTSTDYFTVQVWQQTGASQIPRVDFAVHGIGATT